MGVGHHLTQLYLVSEVEELAGAVSRTSQGSPTGWDVLTLAAVLPPERGAKIGIRAGAGLLKLARKYRLNASSHPSHLFLDNLDMRVGDFVGKFRLASTKGALPAEVLEMTVGEALLSPHRKLLTDGRWMK
jgi:hypothetical protein